MKCDIFWVIAINWHEMEWHTMPMNLKPNRKINTKRLKFFFLPLFFCPFSEWIHIWWKYISPFSSWWPKWELIRCGSNFALLMVASSLLFGCLGCVNLNLCSFFLHLISFIAHFPHSLNEILWQFIWNSYTKRKHKY